MPCEVGPLKGLPRARAARRVRRKAAQVEFNTGVRQHPCNNDETTFATQNYIGSFTKGLRHNALGEVVPSAYDALLAALSSGNPADFDALDPHLGCRDSGNMVDRARQRLFENPQAGYAFELEGVDPHQAGPLAATCGLDTFPAPPEFSSSDEIGEMAELYWMALARDVPFTEYPTNPLIADAASDLNTFDLFAGLTPATVFRGSADGDFGHPDPPDFIGPYVSQFLLQDVPYGAQLIPARIRTLLPNVDYLTVYEDWLNIQNGCDANQMACDPTLRLIRNGRDLGQFVHIDTVFQAFFNACLILLMGRETRRCEAAAGMGVPFGEQLPYVNPFAPRAEEPANKSSTEIGIATFGPQHIQTLVVEVTTRAMKAAWYQKWLVHRRLRPEEFGGRIHNHAVGKAVYPFHTKEFPRLGPPTDGKAATRVLKRIFEHNRLQNANRRRSDGVAASSLNPNPNPAEPTYLLPVAYAEGSPLHPAYAAGHATVSGACATILKAFFAEDQRIINPVVPNLEGTALVSYTGGDGGGLTVGGELDKLASNVSLGRNFAGVHWRSDHRESIRLGEAVAVRLLIDQAFTYNEDFELRFTRFNGQPMVITKTSAIIAGGGKITTVTCGDGTGGGTSVVGSVVT